MLSNYKILVPLLIICSSALAKIEDNSFLLEEAYNQEKGVYQFIQTYQNFGKSGRYRYAFENEIPITDQTRQFSYEFKFERSDGEGHGAVNDPVINYRIQPYNKNDFMLADRFGLIIPLGRVEKDAGHGVWGMEFMQAGSLMLSNDFETHFNIGVDFLPAAKFQDTDKRRTLTNFILGSSVVYHWKDKFNFLVEALFETEQQVNNTGTNKDDAKFAISPGMRWAIDLGWQETQIVQGISFPVELVNSPTEKSVFFYFSVEPSFL